METDEGGGKGERKKEEGRRARNEENGKGERKMPKAIWEGRPE